MASRAGSGGGGGGPVALILSAGASHRFEGRPKALLPVGRETAIVRIARLCRSAGYARTIAVLGAHREEIRRTLGPADLELLDHPEWARGRTGSLQRGLHEVPEATELLVWPVDHPFVAPTTLGVLRAAARSPGLATWWIPTFRGESGHPVLLGPSVFAQLLDLPPHAPLRSVLPGLGPQVRRVAVEDPGVLENADSVDAYWAALSAWEARGGGSDGP